jgi:hypothetical protein
LFFEHGNWDDAIAELNQAYGVLPHDSELGFVLGKAYASEYREGKVDSNRAQAEKLFRLCITRDATHVEAIRELTDLEKLADENASLTSWLKPVLIVLAGYLRWGSSLGEIQ